MTFAESAARNGRDDDHMIYEMFHLSQYEDGSVLDCLTMTAFTAQQVVDGACDNQRVPGGSNAVIGDLKRNAKAALKHGKTENRAPRVW